MSCHLSQNVRKKLIFNASYERICYTEMQSGIFQRQMSSLRRFQSNSLKVPKEPTK